jgi:hypothetical protein
MSLVRAYLSTLEHEDRLRNAAMERTLRAARRPDDGFSDADVVVRPAPRRVLARVAVRVSRIAASAAHRLDPAVEVTVTRRLQAGC